MHFFFDWDANFYLSEPKGTEEGLKNHHRHLIGFILFVLCRVPDGTLSSNETINIFNFPKKKCIFAFLFYCCARNAPGAART